MSRIGPIIIIEDDEDDRELLEEAFKSNNTFNQRLYFDTCGDAYHYLSTTADKPFVIFSDINLPGMTGSELKKKINADERLRRKSIPFVFLTTSSAHETVLEAYDLMAQGIFIKPASFKLLTQTIELILSYWKICRHPNPDLI